MFYSKGNTYGYGLAVKDSCSAPLSKLQHTFRCRNMQTGFYGFFNESFDQSE